MQAMRWLLFTDTAQLDPRSNSSSTIISNTWAGAAMATRVHGDSAITASRPDAASGGCMLFWTW